MSKDKQSDCPLDGFPLQTYCSMHEHVVEDKDYECPFKDECKQMREDYERRKAV